MALVTARFTYDVFLSFRGEDTRHGFTGNLWKALNDRGIRTFMDDEELQKGEEITPSLVKAVEESKIAIVVLSKNYASSSFCLQELAKILDCSIKEKGLSVLPVFYDADPSGVRNLMGTYGEAMAMHEAMDKTLQEWKKALHRMANMPGFHFNDRVGYDEFGYELEVIERIVEKVVRKLNCAPLHDVTNYSAGLEDSPLLEQVCSLLLEWEQLEALVVEPNWFGSSGSRIIITTLPQAPRDSIFTILPYLPKLIICGLPPYMAFWLRDYLFPPPKMKKDLITKNLPFVSPKLAELLKLVTSQTFPSVLDSFLQISRGRLPEALQILPSVSEVVLQISPSSLEVLQISQWDCEDETKWRLVGLLSSVVGLLCYALSPSFNREFGGWNSLKFILYGVLSLVICTTILFAKKTLLSTQYVQLRSYISFAVLMIISVYSFYYDKAVDGKPETLSLVSNAAFALVSLSLSKLTRFGFEMGIFSYFLGCLVVQLWTIDWKLILVAIIFGCPLFRMHSPLNSRREVYSSLNSEPEVDSAQVFNSLSTDSDPEVHGGRHHLIDIHT